MCPLYDTAECPHLCLRLQRIDEHHVRTSIRKQLRTLQRLLKRHCLFGIRSGHNDDVCTLISGIAGGLDPLHGLLPPDNALSAHMPA